MNNVLRHIEEALSALHAEIAKTPHTNSAQLKRLGAIERLLDTAWTKAYNAKEEVA